MPKCGCKLYCNFIEITLRHGCSPVNLLHIFRTPFPKNTSGGLLLYVVIISVSLSSCFLMTHTAITSINRKILFQIKGERSMVLPVTQVIP